MDEGLKIRSAVYVLALEGFDSTVLSVLNNAIIGFGRVSEANLAYKPALDAVLIKEDGMPIDLEALLFACSFEVNRRVKAGTFK